MSVKKKDVASGLEKERRKSKEEEMNWHLKSVKRGKLGKHLRNKEKRKSMRRKRQSLRKLKGKRGRKSVKLKKSSRGRKKKEVKTREMIDWVEIEEVLGELAAEGRRMMGLGVEHGEAVVEVVAGGIERRGRKTSGDQGVEIEEKEGMMTVHPEDVARHLQEEVLHQEEDLHQEVMAELGEGGMLPQEDLHQGAEEVGMTVLREGDHHQEEILETEMVAVLGVQAPGTILHATVEVQEEVVGILVKDEVLHQDVWVTGHHLDEGHLLGGTLVEMMIGGVLHPDVLPLTEMGEECGAVVVIGHPLGEDLLLGVDLPQGEVHPRGVALPLAEDQDPVTMDLLIGAVTDLLHVTIHPLLNRPDQPVIIKTMAGQLSSVKPKIPWEYPGCQALNPRS